ncbi:MAG: hypothetical protein ABJP06_05890 [Sulfitobacter sp.]
MLDPLPDPITRTTALWPAEARLKFTDIRALILEAGARADIGPLTESLKWGQPAWRPDRPRKGSTLRLNWSDKLPRTLALFVDCKTTLAAEIFAAYPDDFQYESNRAMRMQLNAPLPKDAIAYLAHATFTYHQNT